MSARQDWPRRRVEPQATPEAGTLPFSFEPEETLGDTDYGDLDDDEANEAHWHRVRERQATRAMYAVVLLAVLAWYYGYIA